MTECLTRHEYGPTGHCKWGRHSNCQAGDGMASHSYVTLGEVVIADVVSPMLTYRCPCDCHTSTPCGQLDFGLALVTQEEPK